MMTVRGERWIGKCAYLAKNTVYRAFPLLHILPLDLLFYVLHSTGNTPNSTKYRSSSGAGLRRFDCRCGMDYVWPFESLSNPSSIRLGRRNVQLCSNVLRDIRDGRMHATRPRNRASADPI